MKRILVVAIIFITNQLFSQEIPKWFLENMEQSLGTWVANNKEYQNDKEPMESYGMDWKWGIGKKSIVGELYGFIKGKKTGPFWEFRQYWDFEKNKGIIVQYGSNGVIGIGPVKVLDDGEIEIVQAFTTPDGKQTDHGHRSTLNGDEFTSTSFLIDNSGKWNKNRTYIWHKYHIVNDLGEFSISLTVKDIKSSKAFYEKLGFTIVDGNVGKKWLILKSGTSRIGLFQGMFPKNTITFNPQQDIRKIYAQKVNGKIDTQMTTGLDKKSGKASFMVTDPDGNPILIDQHQ